MCNGGPELINVIIQLTLNMSVNGLSLGPNDVSVGERPWTPAYFDTDVSNVTTVGGPIVLPAGNITVGTTDGFANSGSIYARRY